MVALAAACAGTSAAQVPVASFKPPVSFLAPDFPGPLAVTPAGADWVGPAGGIAPDGYPEVVVAQGPDGDRFSTASTIRFYRNENDWNANPGTSLVADIFTSDLDVLADFESRLPFVVAPLEGEIWDIELVDMNDDDAADLLVAFTYFDAFGFQRGVVAHYRADDVGTTNFGFTVQDFERFDVPVAGIAVDEFTQDGMPDVIVASGQEIDIDPTAAPLGRVFRLKNDTDGTTFGFLTREADQVVDNTIRPTYNVVTGEFNRIRSGIGGNIRDFLTFGGNAPEQLRLGIGDGTGPFSFSMTLEDGTNCAMNNGLHIGDNSFVGTDGLSAFVVFDPFASVDQSLATAAPNELRLLHNRPRRGDFFHLCDGMNNNADFYELSCNSATSVSANGANAFIASGNLNLDAFDDIVHIDSGSKQPTILLGRGTPDANNRIMQFECNSFYRLPVYSPGNNGSFATTDRVLCADLNLDGRDDILIAADNTPSELVVYINRTLTSSP